jgi:hypothetical protein
VSTGTCEFVLLVIFADIGDMFESQVQNKDLNEAGEGCGDDLSHEHGARGYLHVVTELEIRDET